MIERGYSGSERHIRKAVQPWRKGTGRPVKSKLPVKWLVLRPSQGLNSSEKAELDHLLQTNSPLASGHQLKEWFQEIVKQGDLEALDAWAHESSRSGLKQFKSVARSFR